MKRYLFCLCLAVMPQMSIACVTAADLEDGIVITSGKPAARLTHVVRRVEGDLVWRSQHSDMFPDTWSRYTHNGLFGLFTHRQSGSGQSVSRYDQPLPPMDRIVPGVVLQAQRTWGAPDGSKTWSGLLTFEVSEAPPIQVGDCTYAAIRLETHGDVTYPDGEIKAFNPTRVIIPELAYELGYNSIVSIEKAGWFTDVMTDRAMLRQAAKMPDLADVLSRYGVN